MQKCGGTESLEEDAGELSDVAKGGGMLSDKARAAKAIKEPGAHEQPSAAASDEQN